MTEEDYQLRIHELEKEISKLRQEIKRNSDTTYGLRWMDVPEASDGEDRIPILEEVKDKAIVQHDGQPTHILIEGDNYHALTCLNYTHKGKIDVIYIDPPYNTGSDGFVYKDKRVLDKFPDGTPVPTDHPLRHSYWLSFMEKRLRLAKNLLSDKGVIFISIDDNEIANLKLLCDQVFGEKNFIEIFSWNKTETPANLSVKTKKAIEYILCYENTRNNNKYIGLSKTSASNNGLMNQTNSIHDLIFPPHIVDTKLPNGIYKAGNYGTSSYQIQLLEDTEVLSGFFIRPVKLHGRFKWSQENLNNEITKGTKISIKTIAFSPSYEKLDYEPEVPWNLINKNFGVDTNEVASSMIKDILPEEVFSFPKPVTLIKYLLKFNGGTTILDFFAGSGTTMHATMALNAEDGGHRQCILVQQQEDSKICEKVTYERNKRVMCGYTNSKGQYVDGLGGSLKYYRTDFVGEHCHLNATDNDRIALSQKAGNLLALAENTLQELTATYRYQIFQEKDGDIATNGCMFTAVYFSDDLDKFGEFVQQIEQLQAENDYPHITIYLFCWDTPENYKEEFNNLRGLTLKAIPQPILDIYRRINN